MSVFALCQSAGSRRAADALLEKLFKDCRRPDSIVWSMPIDTQSGVVEAFSQLVVLIESRLIDANHCRLVAPPATVMVDHVRAGYLCPWSDSASWEAVIALLVLTFPDVNWLFMSGFAPEGGLDVAGHHRLHEVRAIDLARIPRPNPLFDGIGLREFVRRSVPQNKKSPNPIVAERKHVAAAIDDEEAFAMYHAYVAYRQGYRAEAVVRFSHMEKYFKKESDKAFDLVMQDQSLNFPDKPYYEHLSVLRNRYELFPRLKCSGDSVLVTSGQDGGSGEGTTKKNVEFLIEKGGRGEPVLKPVGDMFDFWKEVKNRSGLTHGSLCETTSFTYLAEPQPESSEPSEEKSHAAPGRLMLVAATLIRRAESLKQQGMDAMTSIRGAVFATDALELLAGKTPTMSWEALALKHELEVRAETSFIGCGYHASTDRETTRRKEIESDCDSIAEWFHPTSREKASRNAQMQIAGTLIRHYRSVGQFEEETEYAKWAGDIEWKLKLHGSRNKIEYCFNYVARAYYLLALQTPKKVCGGIVFWLSVLGLAFGYFGNPSNSNLCYVSDAITSFFGMGPPYRPLVDSIEKLGVAAHGIATPQCIDSNKETGGYAFVVAVSIILGALHLGALVALVVSRLSRK